MPTTPADIRRLQELQADVTRGELAVVERNELAFRLWREGMTQREIAEVLDHVDRDHGGEGITHAMTSKTLARMRAARETDLLAAASG